MEPSRPEATDGGASSIGSTRASGAASGTASGTASGSPRARTASSSSTKRSHAVLRARPAAESGAV
eukprot:scaffold119719_cov42-Phaeocystis_antarctica.AAC.1